MTYQQLNNHFTEELMEERHFGRLTETESRLFDLHARICQSCAIRFQNERMFIFSMQAALERPEPFENRDGATFQVRAQVACAA